MDDRSDGGGAKMAMTLRRSAVLVAISQYGAVDAVMVLVLQARLVRDVAHLYAQRPTLRDMATLYFNVAGTAFVAGKIEEAELSEYVQPVISSVLGSAASVVPGLQATTSVVVQSLVSGAANAFLTLRVGIMAQEYSRGADSPRARPATSRRDPQGGGIARRNHGRGCRGRSRRFSAALPGHPSRLLQRA